MALESAAKRRRAKTKARGKTAAKTRAPAKKKKVAAAPTTTKTKTTTKKAAARKRAPAKVANKKKAAPKRTGKKVAPKRPSAKAAKAAPKRAPAKVAKAAPKPAPARKLPAPRPSERSIAAVTLLPRDERSLDDVERSAMAKVAAKARLLLGGGFGAPADVVARIASYVDDVRKGAAAPPRDRDELFGLGVLWGEQLRHQVGWLWVHLTYEDGLSSFALVPDDRAFAVFPINRLLDLLDPGSPHLGANTIAERFHAICNEELPQRRPNAYLVIG